MGILSYLEFGLSRNARIRLDHSCFENLFEMGMNYVDKEHIMDELELDNGQIEQTYAIPL